jgi:hypothetical protein
LILEDDSELLSISIGFLTSLFFFLITNSSLSLFDEAELDTFTLGNGDSRGLTVTNDENVLQPGGENIALHISDVGNIEGTLMLLDRLKNTNTTNIVSSNEHNRGTVGELDNRLDITSGEINLDRIVDGDVGVRISHGSTVMGSNVRDLLLVDGLFNNLAELELGLIRGDRVSLEAALGVKEDSEVLVSFLDRDDVHVTKRETRISSRFTINLDETILILDNLSGLLSVEGITESLLEENVEGDALSKLVRTRGRPGRVNTLKFSKVPLLGSSNSLQ